MTTTDPNALIRLRNGREAPASAVRTTWLALERLSDSSEITDVMALYEARELARDPGHSPWPGTPETLRGLGLLDHNGTMHDIVRDVILSAVTGAETDLKVTWPAEGADT